MPKKTFIKTLRLSDKHLEMLKKKAVETGNDENHLIREAIVFYCQNDEPAYVKIAKERARLAEERLKAELEGKVPPTKKEITKEWAGRNICEQLGGEVFDKDGWPYCRYKEYNDFRKPPFHELTVENPLDEIDETTVARQYDPSKEKVEVWQKWLKEQGLIK